MHAARSSMQRPLSSFPLSGNHQAKLVSAGFERAEDLRDVTIVELGKELNISHSEALEILRIVTGKTDSSSNDGSSPGSSVVSCLYSQPPTGRSALELLKAEQLQGYIVTFCAKVDTILGGGIPLGRITEVCGPPGVGKTQISMQLAVDVQIPEVFGGMDGEAVFIDTEGSFIVERVVDIASAAVLHLSGISGASGDPEMQRAASGFTLEKALAGMHYFRCHDYLELVALVNLLPEFLTQHTKVRLVVVDSIASHFRHDFDDMGLRNRILSGLAQNLIKVAVEDNIAVVLTNQMTTKFSQRSSHKGSGTAQLVPALGESWGHACTIRVILSWNGQERCATLYKSPSRKESTAPYQITQDGVRDVLPPQPPQDSPSSQFVSLSSSQMEQFELSQLQQQGESSAGDGKDCSWDQSDWAGGAADFISVSEMCHSAETSVEHLSRKRPHPDDINS